MGIPLPCVIIEIIRTIIHWTQRSSGKLLKNGSPSPTYVVRLQIISVGLYTKKTSVIETVKRLNKTVKYSWLHPSRLYEHPHLSKWNLLQNDDTQFQGTILYNNSAETCSTCRPCLLEDILFNRFSSWIPTQIWKNQFGSIITSRVGCTCIIRTRWYEVKSTYTYDYNGKDDELRVKNHQKWQSVAKTTNEIFDSYIWKTCPVTSKLYVTIRKEISIRYFSDVVVRTRWDSSNI